MELMNEHIVSLPQTIVNDNAIEAGVTHPSKIDGGGSGRPTAPL